MITAKALSKLVNEDVIQRDAFSLSLSLSLS